MFQVVFNNYTLEVFSLSNALKLHATSCGIYLNYIKWCPLYCPEYSYSLQWVSKEAEASVFLMCSMRCTVRWRYNAVVDFLHNHHETHPITRPLGRGMGWFCGFKLTFIFCLVTEMMCTISCHIGPRCNDTYLHLLRWRSTVAVQSNFNISLTLLK